MQPGLVISRFSELRTVGPKQKVTRYAGGSQALIGKRISLDIKNIQRQLGQAIQQGVTWLEARFKRWTQPTKANQVAGALTDLTRSRSELIAENRLLRQQLIVLERQVARPQLRQRDRTAFAIDLLGKVAGRISFVCDSIEMWHEIPSCWLASGQASLPNIASNVRSGLGCCASLHHNNIKIIKQR